MRDKPYPSNHQQLHFAWECETFESEMKALHVLLLTAYLQNVQPQIAHPRAQANLVDNPDHYLKSSKTF